MNQRVLMPVRLLAAVRDPLVPLVLPAQLARLALLVPAALAPLVLPAPLVLLVPPAPAALAPLALPALRVLPAPAVLVAPDHRRCDITRPGAVSAAAERHVA
jgi:hypothetical protein